MKKLLLITVAASSLLFACKKHEMAPSSAAKSVTTTFSVASGLAESSSTLMSGSRARVLAAPIPVATPYLIAYFYDSTSKLLAKITQKKASTTNYGTFTTQLPLGTVYAFFIATDDTTFTMSLSKAHSAGTAQMPNGYPAITYPTGYFGPTTTNFFSTSRKLNITAPSTQPIVLTRAASQIVVKVDDYIQPNTYYYYQQTNPNFQFDLLDQAGENVGAETGVQQTITPTAGTTGYTYSVIVYPGVGDTHTFSSLSVTKTLFAATDTIKRNTKYTFEGYMSNLRSTTSTIVTDTTWSAPVNKSFIRFKNAQQ